MTEKINDCCNNERNLALLTENGHTFRKCIVCGCRHFIIQADIGSLKWVGKDLGKKNDPSKAG